jgi:hypothetical protein
MSPVFSGSLTASAASSEGSGSVMLPGSLETAASGSRMGNPALAHAVGSPSEQQGNAIGNSGYSTYR